MLVRNRLQGVWPSYGEGVKLCKKWISSHFLSNHLADEVIELLVAYLFLNPEPFQVPRYKTIVMHLLFYFIVNVRSSAVVFYRFLFLLTSHDWSHDPLIINIDGSVSGRTVLMKFVW